MLNESVGRSAAKWKWKSLFLSFYLPLSDEKWSRNFILLIEEKEGLFPFPSWNQQLSITTFNSLSQQKFQGNFLPSATLKSCRGKRGQKITINLFRFPHCFVLFLQRTPPSSFPSSYQFILWQFKFPINSPTSDPSKKRAENRYRGVDWGNKNRQQKHNKEDGCRDRGGWWWWGD